MLGLVGAPLISSYVAERRIEWRLDAPRIVRVPHRWVGGDPAAYNDPRYLRLRPWQTEALELARDAWRSREDTDAPRTCGKPIPVSWTRPRRNGRPSRWAGRAWEPCRREAGDRTDSPGYGPCSAHGGRGRRGRAEGAWMAAHAFSQELNVSPWDALLMAVRIAAGKVAYCQLVLSRASSDLEVEGRIVRGDDGLLVDPDTGDPLGVGQMRDLSFWNGRLEFWHARMAQCAKWAIDAGVAAWQVQQMESQAQVIARVVNASLDALGDEATDAQRARVRAAARAELLMIDAEQRQVAAVGSADTGSVDSTWTDT